MKKLIVGFAILISLIGFSKVKRMKYISNEGEYQIFSTKNEKFSGKFDLIIPQIGIIKNKKPILKIRFFEIGELNEFRKIKISNGEKKVMLNVVDGEPHFILIIFDNNKIAYNAEYVDKIIDIKDLETLLNMSISKKTINIDFINKKNNVIKKEVNAKEKEILKWTILNYKALLDKK